MARTSTRSDASLGNLTDTQVAVLSLLGKSLMGSDLPMPDDVDWQAVMEEMIAQAVFAIPSGALPDTIPSAIQEAWHKRSLQNVAETIKLLAAQSRATRLLSEDDPSIVVLKGAAAAFYYPDPRLRCMGDVDLLSLDGRFDSMCSLLEASGYGYRGMGGASHDQYVKDGVLFEPHRFFAAPPGSASALRAVDDFINVASDRARTERVCGFDTPMLPDAENGLILLAYLALHLRRGIGLRHVCDWMMFAHRVCDDAFWREELEPMATQASLATLAETTTRLCQLYLGMPEEGRSWCLGADEAACKALLLDALANGNFGRKRTAVLDYNYGMSLYNIKHPLELMERIQRTGRENSSGKDSRNQP